MSEQGHASYAVEVIGRQTSNLIRLVDDLLDINRINQGKIVLQLATIDMRNVVEQAIETCRPLIASRKHELSVRVTSQPVPVRGDMVRLAQVIINLLTNAANYTSPGGRIELELETQGGDPGEAVVTVTDNGIGIPAEMVARIFEPYQQVSQAHERATGGLGLGLTVCRRLMEMHGGSVEARSEGPGRGARFVARLALADSRVGERGRGACARASGCVAARAHRRRQSRRGRVARAPARDIGTRRAGRVERRGRCCRAYSVRPDVVVLDIGLPGMDGYEVARRLRELPSGAAILLIAMTGYGSAEDRAKSAESGIDHHLVKPINFADLEQLLLRPD